MNKKIMVLLIMIICVLTFNVDVVAKTNNQIKKQLNNSEAILSYSLTKDNFLEINKLKNKRSDIKNLENVEPQKVNSEIKAYYYDTVDFDNKFVRYIEWYKKVDGSWVNFKEEKREGVKFSEASARYDFISSIEYNISSPSLENELESVDDAIRINNNGQAGFYKKESQSSLYDYYQLLEYGTKYNSNQTNGFHTATTSVYDTTDADFKTITKVQHKNNRPVNMRATTYLENKKLYLVKIDNYENSYRFSNPYYLSEETMRFYEYNNNEKLIYFARFDTNYEVYEKFYARNEKDRIIANRIVKLDSDESREYVIKYKYNYKGEKTHYIKYKYKDDRIIQRNEYLYNTKGKINTRYTTTYKKGKKNKTTKYLYNSKGKIVKKYQVKHRKDFNTDIINFHYYGLAVYSYYG